MEKISLRVPSRPEFVTTLRLVTASLAQMADFDVETIDDLRVCISEAVNYLLPINEEIGVEFALGEEDFTIEIDAEYEGAQEADQDLHRMILESLMDQVEYHKDGITLVKSRA